MNHDLALGYIILDEHGPYELHDEYDRRPTGPILCHAAAATIFRTRWRARRAIELTRRYAERQGLPWLEHHRYDICRVSEERNG